MLKLSYLGPLYFNCQVIVKYKTCVKNYKYEPNIITKKCSILNHLNNWWYDIYTYKEKICQ